MTTIITFDDFAVFTSEKLGYDRNDILIKVKINGNLVPYWDQTGVYQYLADDAMKITIYSDKFKEVYTVKELLQVEKVYPIVKIKKNNSDDYFNGSLVDMEDGTYDASLIGFKY